MAKVRVGDKVRVRVVGIRLTKGRRCLTLPLTWPRRRAWRWSTRAACIGTSLSRRRSDQGYGLRVRARARVRVKVVRVVRVKERVRVKDRVMVRVRVRVRVRVS